MKIKIFLCAFILCSNVHALNQFKVPPDTPKTSIVLYQSFSTMNDAAIAGFKQAIPLSKEIEYGGAILKYDNRYYYTNPVTIHMPGSIDFRIVKYKDAEIVALYHTHPLSSIVEFPADVERFSERDMRTAIVNDIFSYIWSEDDNKIRIFMPRSSKVEMSFNKQHDFDGYYSMGTLIN